MLGAALRLTSSVKHCGTDGETCVPQGLGNHGVKRGVACCWTCMSALLRILKSSVLPGRCGSKKIKKNEEPGEAMQMIEPSEIFY